MTKEELVKKLDDAADKHDVGEDFMGSPQEAAEHQGKCEAFAQASFWASQLD